MSLLGSCPCFRSWSLAYGAHLVIRVYEVRRPNGFCGTALFPFYFNTCRQHLWHRVSYN